MKKIFMLALIIAFISFPLVQLGNCQPPQTKLVVTPQFSTTTTDVYITVTVDIVNAYNVYSYQFRMNWTNPILNVTSITQGPFLSRNGAFGTTFIQKKFNADGNLLVGSTQTTNDPTTAQSGNGTLATITFIAEKTGTTTLHLYDTKILDFFGVAYDHVTEDGLFSNEIHEVNAGDSTFTVITQSNSTIYNFSFNETGKSIVFSATNVTGSGVGFCNATIPKALLRAPDPNVWQIFVNTSLITDFIKTENETHTFLYFTFNMSTHIIQIKGTEVVPEFSSLILVMMLTATLLILVARQVYTKKKHISR